MQRRELVLAFVAILVLPGCLGGGDAQMSAEAKQLQSESTEAMQDVERYRFEMTTEVSLNDRSVRIDANGIINRADRRARLDMSMSGPRSLEMVMYLVDDTAYARTGGRWIRQDVSDRGIWDQNAQLERQRKILAASSLEITGETTVDGESVHVVKADIPKDKLDELTSLARQQSGSSSDASITKATYTFYIDKESNLTRKVSADMKLKLNGKTADASVSMTFSDYGTNTSITVPAEARESTGSQTAVTPLAV